MKNINLYGRLKAYAKLTVEKDANLIDKEITENGVYDASSEGADGYRQVTVNVQGSVGGDDFLKKILSLPVDTLIDLGYKDSVSNREVYALRRHFTFTFDADKEYTISLANNVEDVFTTNGFISYDYGRTQFPIYERDQNAVIEKKYRCVERFNSTQTCTIDTYFVFTGTKEYITYEDVGDYSVDEEMRYSLLIGDENCTVTVRHADTIVEEGDNVLIDGETYSVSVETDSGFVLKSVLINDESQQVEDPNYTFVCEGDVSIYAYAQESHQSRYDLYTQASNCDIVVRDSHGSIVYSGEDVLNLGEEYQVDVYPYEGYEIDSVTINSESIDVLPHYFECGGFVSIIASAVESEPSDNGQITIENNAQGTVITIYNTDGEEIQEIDYTASYTINLKNYEDGLVINPPFLSDVSVTFTGTYNSIPYNDETLLVRPNEYTGVMCAVTPDDQDIVWYCEEGQICKGTISVSRDV